MKKLALIVLVVVLAACSGDDSAPPSSPEADTGWRERVTAELAVLDPAQRATFAALQPQTTRAGTRRFTTAAIHDRRVAAVFLERLAQRGDDEATRAALAEALPRTGGSYADAIVELMGGEPSALVRSVYVHAARRAPTDHALAILRRGFADSALEVRAEAARTTAAHRAGARLAPELRAALVDSDPVLRAEAARSLGILRVAVARADLERLRGDGVAEVRQAAVRAIDRIETIGTQP